MGMGGSRAFLAEGCVSPYTFLLDTYATERRKTPSVWSHFNDEDLGFRPEPVLEGNIESPSLPGPGAAPPTERPDRR